MHSRQRSFTYVWEPDEVHHPQIWIIRSVISRVIIEESSTTVEQWRSKIPRVQSLTRWMFHSFGWHPFDPALATSDSVQVVRESSEINYENCANLADFAAKARKESIRKRKTLINSYRLHFHLSHWGLIRVFSFSALHGKHSRTHAMGHAHYAIVDRRKW